MKAIQWAHYVMTGVESGEDTFPVVRVLDKKRVVFESFKKLNDLDSYVKFEFLSTLIAWCIYQIQTLNVKRKEEEMQNRNAKKRSKNEH